MTLSRSISHQRSLLLIALTVVAIILLSATSGPTSTNAQPLQQGTESATATPKDQGQALEDWRDAISQIPRPGKGCFEAAYPDKTWRQDACTAAPSYPMPPGRGPRPVTIGNLDDVSPQVPAGSFINQAIGSFVSVSGITSESSPVNNTGPSITDAYTLQLNTDFFTSTVCNGAATPANCKGWEQFVFENNNTVHRAFIQYWIIKYNNPCPAGGWNQFSFGGGSTDIYCYRND